MILPSHTDQPIIRRLNEKDALAYRNLRLEALKNSPTAFGASYEERKDRLIIDWSRDLTEAQNTEAIFAADAQDELVGMIGIRIRVGQKTRHAATIWGVYVRPAWRGQRLCAAMMTACIEWAVQREIKTLKLAVVTTNTPAVKAYERMGFKPYGLEPAVLFYNGTYYDEYLMYREI